jgi:hypothetical protein
MPTIEKRGGGQHHERWSSLDLERCISFRPKTPPKMLSQANALNDDDVAGYCSKGGCDNDTVKVHAIFANLDSVEGFEDYASAKFPKSQGRLKPLKTSHQCS